MAGAGRGGSRVLEGVAEELIGDGPGQSATGTWHLNGDEWFFPGHFPGRPTLPVRMARLQSAMMP